MELCLLHSYDDILLKFTFVSEEFVQFCLLRFSLEWVLNNLSVMYFTYQ